MVDPKKESTETVDESVDSDFGAEDKGNLEENFTPNIDDDSDTLADDTDESEESTDDGEPLSAEGDATPEEDDGEELDLKDFGDEPEHKSGEQKRIDKLTAQLRATEERLAAIEGEKTESSKQSEKPKFSRGQLQKAIEDGIDKGDSNLILEVFEYMAESTKEALRNEYTSEQQKVVKAQEQKLQEWTSLVEDNSYLWEDSEGEIYKGARKELDLTNPNSLLKQLANRIYLDPQRAKVYQVPGGQRLAVADALGKILKKRKVSPKGKENTRLKRSLAKEKRKSSLSPSKSSKNVKTSSGPVSQKSALDNYINERKKIKNLASSF